MTGFVHTHTIGKVELWQHPEGHKFIRFVDSKLKGTEIPLPKQIPKKDSPGVNFVTNMKTSVGGKKQKIWLKEVGSEADEIIRHEFTNPKNRYRKNTHHARLLKEMKAAGFQVPEAHGILYPKNGKPLMITNHVRGREFNLYAHRDALTKFMTRLVNAGFAPRDMHAGNIFKNFKGYAIIDASRFVATDKEKLARAIAKRKQRKTFMQKLKSRFRKK